MTNKIHQSFVQIAADVSPTLSDALRSVGPQTIRTRDDQPLPDTLCRMVAGQQLSTKAAATIWQRVLDLSGKQPLCHTIKRASLSDLRACGLSGSKAKAIKGIVRAAESPQLDVEKLRGLDHLQRSVHLTSLWGVGQWTADMIGIFYFGDINVWPQGDVTVIKTLQHLTSRRRNPLLTAQRFAPRRSLLALYMYRIADAPPTDPPTDSPTDPR